MGDIPERGQTLSFLDEIEAKFQTFDGPVYHVLGNHDMDSISKSEFLAHTSNYGSAKGKPYYSFVRNQIKFIVLDGIATRMVPIMIPVISIGRKRLSRPGRRNGSGRTEERRFAGRDLYPRIVGYFLRD